MSKGGGKAKEKKSASRKASQRDKRAKAPARRSLESIPLRPADDDALYNVVIETSKGSPNKLGYDDALGAFTLHAVLPQGAVFPFDFGFLPRTKGGDGDPLDVLVLMQSPVPAGTVVPTRLIGVIEAKQREKDGKTVTNDRLIGVAPSCALYRDVNALADLPNAVVDEIEQFFVNYARQEGKEFRAKGRADGRRAAALARQGERARER